MTWDDLYRLHSDRDLEMGEILRTGYQVEPQNRRLTHDYLLLFEALLEDEDQPVEGLAMRLGLPNDLAEQDRRFIGELRTGALINPNDRSRNVAFKVVTFQLLLKGLEEGLKSELVSGQREKESDIKREGIVEKGTAKILDGFLRSAGRKCGEAFGYSLRQGWTQTAQPVPNALSVTARAVAKRG